MVFQMMENPIALLDRVLADPDALKTHPVFDAVQRRLSRMTSMANEEFILAAGQAWRDAVAATRRELGPGWRRKGVSAELRPANWTPPVWAYGGQFRGPRPEPQKSDEGCYKRDDGGCNNYGCDGVCVSGGLNACLCSKSSSEAYTTVLLPTKIRRPGPRVPDERVPDDGPQHDPKCVAHDYPEQDLWCTPKPNCETAFCAPITLPWITGGGMTVYRTVCACIKSTEPEEPVPVPSEPFPWRWVFLGVAVLAILVVLWSIFDGAMLPFLPKILGLIKTGMPMKLLVGAVLALLTGRDA